VQQRPLQSAGPEISRTACAPRVRWWDIALPAAGVGCVFLLLMLAVAAVVLKTGNPDIVDRLVARLQSVEDGYFLNIAVMTVLYVVPLGVMKWIVRRRKLEFFGAVPQQTIALALAGGVVFALAFQALQDFLVKKSLVVYIPSKSELLLVPHSYAQLALGLGLVVLLGPFVEELYFRGLLFAWCRQRMPLIWATLINAVSFGIVHFYFLQHVGLEGVFITVVIALFGALNVFWVVRTGSLWPAFASHAAYNSVGLILLFLSS
jgi:membrane protease YdiL (CAAX protease family)